MAVLEAMRPYPSNKGATLDEDEQWFLVYRIEGGHHVVMDSDIVLVDSALVDTSLLFMEGFNLPEWYAKWRLAEVGASLTHRNCWSVGLVMGDVLAIGLANAICEGHGTYNLGNYDMPASDHWCIEVMEVNRRRNYDTYVICNLATQSHIPVQQA